MRTLENYQSPLIYPEEIVPEGLSFCISAAFEMPESTDYDNIVWTENA